MRRASSILLCALLFAGCTRDEDMGLGVPEGATFETTSIPIQVDAGGLPAPPPVGDPNGAAGEVSVPANATGLLVEAQWTCQSPTCTMELVLLDPNGTEVARSPGSGSASVGARNVTAGAYGIQLAFAGEPIVQAQGEIRATVFSGGPIPADFTAFNGTAARHPRA